MTDFAEEYRNLSQRREAIVSNLAVRRADEERKRKEREAIEAQLREAGIDPSKPDEEIARLTREIEEDRSRISKELDEVENLLKPKASSPELVSQSQSPVEILRDAINKIADEAGLEVDNESFDEAGKVVSSEADILID